MTGVDRILPHAVQSLRRRKLLNTDHTDGGRKTRTCMYVYTYTRVHTCRCTHTSTHECGLGGDGSTVVPPGVPVAAQRKQI